MKDFLHDFPIGVACIDNEGTVFFWNRAAEEQIGLAPAEVLGRPLWGAWPSETAQGFRHELQKTTGTEVVRRSVCLPQADGGQLFLRIEAFRLHNDERGHYGHFLLLHPCSRESTESGSGAGQPPVPRRFVHDLNNVFTNIISCADLAAGVPGAAAEIQECLAECRSTAIRGAALLRQLVGSTQPAAKLASGPSSGGGGAAKGASSAGRILVVDDERPVRMLLRAVLAQRGYEVALAEDGAAGVKAFETAGPFDAVVLDLDLPVLSGAQVWAKICEGCPGARAVLLSGAPAEKGVESLLESPRVRYVAKPFHNAELIDALQQVLKA